MIACPICGGETAVTETRATGGGARRRRRCADRTCAGKVTTVEVVVTSQFGAADLAAGDTVIVARRLIARLQKDIAILAGDLP